MEWISIKDKAPNHKQMVIVSIPDKELGQDCHVCEFANYGTSLQWQIIAGNSPDYTIYANTHGVTHWMPLPEPPK